MRALFLKRPAVFLSLVVALAIMGWRGWGSSPGRRPPLPLWQWELADMIAHLRDGGLNLRVVPTSLHGPLGRTVFLTRTDKNWMELSRPPASRNHVGRWTGSLVVYRFRHHVADATNVEHWGDCCVVAGPFAFFGDPQLLEQVRAVLGDEAEVPPAGPQPAASVY